MLLRRSHWHVATQRDPEREARLLWISNANATSGNTLDPNKQEQQDNPLDNSVHYAQPGLDARGKPLENETETTQQHTRQGVAHALATPQEPESNKEKKKNSAASTEQPSEREMLRARFERMIKETGALSDSMQDLLYKMENKELNEKLKSVASKEAYDAWIKRISLLREEQYRTQQEKVYLEDIFDFWTGDTPPQVFLAAQADYFANLPYGFAHQGKALQEAVQIQREALSIPESMSLEEWRTLNESTRLTFIDSVMRDVRMSEWLESIDKQNVEMRKVLAAETKEIAEIETRASALNLEQEILPATSFISSLRGVRFYSIKDFMEGTKKYWAALKNAWERRGERYSADVAKAIGGVLRPFDIWPFYGEEVAQVLDQQVDAKNAEEAKGYREKLEADNANWKMVFGENGEFWKVAGKNANASRGILEYAADHGFLYDIDEGITDRRRPIYGMYLDDICTDWRNSPQRIANYYSLLRSKNSAGRDKEEKAGYETDVATDNVPMFITKLEEEMDDFNLWRAAGICRRALERGLWSEISAWVAVTIMNKLHEHPDLRKHTPQIFFDIVGKLSMYNTAFTTGWMKAHRDKLRKWAKTGDRRYLEETEIRYFNIIERDIIAKDTKTDYSTEEGRKELNHKVAHVLAGRAVNLPGGYIHIYQSRYNNYRRGAEDTFQDVADPHKEDSDFATQKTEKPMLPPTIVAKILKYNSTREFTAESWVAGYFSSLVEQARELKSIPELKEAHRNYCNEVRTKMDLHFKGYITKDETACDKQFGLLSGYTPAIAAMVSENLISWDLMKRAKDPSKLFHQLRDHFPDFAREKNLLPSFTSRPSSAGSVSNEPSYQTAA